MAIERLVSQDLPDIADIYDRFAALTADSAELGGSLVLFAGLDRDGIAFATAANIAGAASLGLEADVARAKARIRNGAIDFLVNTLDEALRILKNEIRKKNAVAVALATDSRGALTEMVERGVQPDLVHGSVEGIDTLAGCGARRLDLGAQTGGPPAEEVSWSVDRDSFRWLPAVDRLAAAALVPANRTTTARKRWIENSPRYLGRALAGQRYVQMSEAEAEAFAAAVRRAETGREIPATVTVSRRPGLRPKAP